MEKTNTITWEQIEREHAEMRARDAKLIASGKKTPREIQEENSLFPLDAKFEIPNFAEQIRQEASQ